MNEKTEKVKAAISALGRRVIGSTDRGTNKANQKNGKAIKTNNHKAGAVLDDSRNTLSAAVPLRTERTNGMLRAVKDHLHSEKSFAYRFGDERTKIDPKVKAQQELSIFNYQVRKCPNCDTRFTFGGGKV